MPKRLFVIGNGFDLHHEIASKYSEFASYLERVDRETFQIAEDYLVPERDLWSYLEDRFAEIDVDQIEDYANNFLVSYGAEDWSDSYHHDYEYEIEHICHAISSKVRRHFADWVRQIQIPYRAPVPVKCIDPSALFLNFNYTATLQRIYGVPDNHVFHVHGAASNVDEEIILGHGWQRQPSDLRSRFADEETDVRVSGGFRLIDDLLARTFKPTEEILARNRDFFDGLSGVSEVCILGHSLAAVDALYFEAVIDGVRPDAKWTVSYFGNEESTRRRAEHLGISSSRLSLKLLSDI